jgi:hypothetical protein
MSPFTDELSWPSNSSKVCEGDWASMHWRDLACSCVHMDISCHQPCVIMFVCKSEIRSWSHCSHFTQKHHHFTDDELSWPSNSLKFCECVWAKVYWKNLMCPNVCIWIFPVTSLVLSCLCANLKSEVEATALTSLRSTTTSQMTNYPGPVTRWNTVNVFGQRYIGKIWCVPMCAYGYFLSPALCYHVCVQIWNQKLKPLLSLHSEAPPLHRWRIILAQ